MPVYRGLRLERVRASKQFRDGRFHNTTGVGPALQGSSTGVMREFFFGGRGRTPTAPLPVDNPLASWATPVSPSGLRVTWLGHSTLLLEVDGVRILTDPVFAKRASPVPLVGPKRMHPMPISIDQLPQLDAVLLSHDHHDHLDPVAMRRIAQRGMPIVTSLGVGARLEAFGIHPDQITELDWWETHALLGNAISFTATPAQHFSGRGLGDRNQTLWSSWVLTTRHRRIFFSGDTGLTSELATIGQRFGPFDLTMLEIGAAHPAWQSIHLGPENALRAFEMLGKGTLLPIHWSTFDLALHRWDEPAESLVTSADALGYRVVTPRIGQPVEPARVEQPTRWWRDVAGFTPRAVRDARAAARDAVSRPAIPAREY